MHKAKHFHINQSDGAVRPRCVYCGEAALNAKRRLQSLVDLVAEVWASIDKPLRNGNEGGEVLNQNICRSFSIRFLPRLDVEHVALNFQEPPSE